MIEGFEQQTITLDEALISLHVAGQGVPLLLLHGYPQNHMTWTQVAPKLARHFRVIVADLPGYGDSRVLVDLPGHVGHSKRQMAKVLVQAMARLGHDQFAVLGHDRGARVAYRMALDHGSVVTRLGIIEVVPTVEQWAAFDAETAIAVYHWPFLAQPEPLPEKLIAGAPEFYLNHTLASWTLDKSLTAFPAASKHAYRAQMADPERMHDMCEDYRAGAGVDWELDKQDKAAGRKITAPLHFVWGPGGFPAESGDPLEIWRRWGETVTGNVIKSGHFMPEEAPDAIIAEFLAFFSQGSP